MIRLGDIILVNSLHGSIFSKLIKFFTKHLAKKHSVDEYTHAMYCAGDAGLDTPSVISAEYTIAMMPYNLWADNPQDYRLDRFIINDNLTEEEVRKIIIPIYRLSVGHPYGWKELFWFIYRWIAEKLSIRINLKHNWYVLGDICSENTYRYLLARLKYAYEKCENAFKKQLIINAIKDLEVFSENTVHPVDLAIIMKRYPNLFTKYTVQ